jgi:hypothetical protein
LLFLEDNNSVLAAQKGTPEYEKLFNRLSQINYKHQKDNQTTSPTDIKTKIDGVTDSARKTNQVAATDSNEEN